MRLATGPVNWGVDFADAPGNPPWQLVLDEIAESPVDALELGPVGYLPEDPEQLRGALAARGLEAVGSFVFDDLHDRRRRGEVTAAARRAARAIAAAGGRVLVIIDRPSAARVVAAGRSEDAPRLDRSGWDELLAGIDAVAEIARAEGLVPTVHPHAGGYIEFADEIAAVLRDTDLDLCLDTGHLAFAGEVPAEALLANRARLAHLHLKDVDGAVVDRVRAERLDFWTAIELGVFCPVGTGAIDFAEVVESLRVGEYRGFATIEQDRVPGTGSPLGDLQAGVARLEALLQRGAAR